MHQFKVARGCAAQAATKPAQTQTASHNPSLGATPRRKILAHRFVRQPRPKGQRHKRDGHRVAHTQPVHRRIDSHSDARVPAVPPLVQHGNRSCRRRMAPSCESDSCCREADREGRQRRIANPRYAPRTNARKTSNSIARVLLSGRPLHPTKSYRRMLRSCPTPARSRRRAADRSSNSIRLFHRRDFAKQVTVDSRGVGSISRRLMADFYRAGGRGEHIRRHRVPSAGHPDPPSRVPQRRRLADVYRDYDRCVSNTRTATRHLGSAPIRIRLRRQQFLCASDEIRVGTTSQNCLVQSCKAGWTRERP